MTHQYESSRNGSLTVSQSVSPLWGRLRATSAVYADVRTPAFNNPNKQFYVCRLC